LRALREAARLAFVHERPRLGGGAGARDLKNAVKQREQHQLVDEIDRQALAPGPDEPFEK
jgi:hypothetical protein